ncbi:hypothetical protein INS49_011054 [Diaporthe citri]|uniref:uncharacterized protein n=1 Tax=Diaporthe citri TaxID=83186 RepID=UPI001C811465|nr:uncharacterized protein INS49_011054 [Diaporthe citri]KAG6359998.1 hypothetical protein INS49_011054 [Diaporthe citri]
MSTFNRGAGAPSNTNWAATTSPANETEEQDSIYDADEEKDVLGGTPVKVKTPEQVPAQVDQYGDPPESPEEYRMEFVKENGITGFMLKVASRLRTLKDPHERVCVRHRFWNLIRDLKVDNSARPPYSQKAADNIRHLLEERGLAETLLLDFELLLNVFEERAQKRREELEKTRQEHEEEQRKKQEWDVVKEEDAEDEWEMI